MPAYFVAEVEVINQAGYEPYRALAGASIAQYGGRFITRGGKAELHGVVRGRCGDRSRGSRPRWHHGRECDREGRARSAAVRAR